ncbi:MAG: DUF2975 domain-containing protein [Pseudomonadota bacterium]
MNQDIRKHRIARWSWVLSLAVLITALSLPVVSFIAVLFMSSADMARAIHVPEAVAQGAAPAALISVAGLATLPVLIFSWGLLSVRHALASFQRGVYFSASVFWSLRRLAVALVLSAALRLVVMPLSGALVSLGQEKGSIALFIGSGELMPLLLGSGLWLLAWIFTEAAELEAENKQFV